MKKLLVLGGSHNQIPVIKTAREMGYYVILCDYLEDNPGRKFAHEYYNVSTTDKEAVLVLAETLKIDGIVPYISEVAAPTAAYVGEKLGLSTHPYRAVEILTNKDKFRDFQKKHHFKVPRAKGYESLEEAKLDFNHYKMPVMIKPVDSSGSRGVSKIDSIDFLEDKVNEALKYSRNNRFIIEEYIESNGHHVGGDGFTVDGKLVFLAISNELFPTSSSLNPFVPLISIWPGIMSEQIQMKITNEIQRLLELLQIQTGPFNYEIRMDDSDNVYIIEIAARNGGDWNQEVINYATGVNLIEYTIKAALGENCRDLKFSDCKGYWAVYSITSQKNGLFSHIEFDDEIKNNITEFELFVKPGEQISALSGSHEKLGNIILNFSSMEEMLNKIDNIDRLVKPYIGECSFLTAKNS